MGLTAEQHAIRATGIGGSEIADVAGLGRYSRSINIWERKTGRAPPDAPTHHMLRGQYLEGGMRDWYSQIVNELRGPTSVLPGKTERHPEHKLVVATPDGLVFPNQGALERVLELKSPGFRTADQWGEPGTDEVPIEYVAQTTWEMAVTGAQLADVGALIDGDLRIYTVAYSPSLFEALLERAERWWRDYVVADTPPPPDGSESYSDHLARRFPRSNGDLLIATPEDDALAAALREARDAKDRAESRYEELRQRLQARIADADGLAGTGWKITWREQKGRSSLDQKALAAEAPELVAKHTKQGKSFRVFRPTFSKEQ